MWKLLRLFALCSLFSAFVVPAAAAPPEPAAPQGYSPGAYPWLGFQIVGDQVNDLGGYVSQVVDYEGAQNISEAGTRYISYYDATHGQLWLASPAKNGNCGPGNSWWCRQVVDPNAPNNNIGQFSSIDVYVDLNTYTWKLGIAYRDATAKAVKYAEYACHASTPCGWTFHTIISAVGAGQDTGFYTALKFDNAGNPHFAYQRRTATAGWLDYAKVNSAGTGTCGVGPDNGHWDCLDLDVGSPIVGASHITLDVNGVTPYIAYVNAGHLWFTNPVPWTGSCVINQDWDCSMVDLSPTADVRATAIQVGRGPNFRVRIAYYDYQPGQVKYAALWGASAQMNCGPKVGADYTWLCNTVDTVGSLIGNYGLSMTLGPGNYAWIAYRDGHVDTAPAALKIARPPAALGLPVGNCGTDPHVIFPWQCNLVDGGGQYTDEADFTSIAFLSNGLASVAYYETDSYYNSGSLKVAEQFTRSFLPLTTKSH